ncbi:methyltransferase domain-containing protein [Actinomadura meridiana]|uniref:Methyltransferase domain-containing protein n=1 Tax=Actinomadura meridiana TaxID=559626 RepID=A0ABP8BUU7_9ACTN
MNSSTTVAPPDGGYVHGYSGRETRRLGEQANALVELLHEGTRYAAGSRVLEAGCGVGAQTVHLVSRSPGVRLTALDVSRASLGRARARVESECPGASVEWRHGDLRGLPFPDGAFDHVFACFVLEHLVDPLGALVELRRVLRPGGTITVIEGDHGSAFFHPDSPHARAVIAHQITLQAATGGDALVGRRVEPLLSAAGYDQVRVDPRTVYADRSRPGLARQFTIGTFTAMVAGVRDEAVAAGLTTPADWDRGIADLRRAAEKDGTFHYTFFKGTAVSPTF